MKLFMRNKLPVALVTVLALLVLAMPFSVANAVTELNTELVTNGGAEAGVSNISGWTDDTGYSRWSSSAAYSDWASPAAGSNYFYLYNPSMDYLAGTMSQMITLSGTEGSGLFSAISAGNVSIRLSASMYQNISAGNEAKVILEEYDAGGSLLRTSQLVNTTTSGAMGSYQLNTQANPATRKLKVLLSATLTVSGYAQFDQISIKLMDASTGSAPVFGGDFPTLATTDAGTAYTANFTISDADAGDIDRLTFSASSTNINLVPTANIAVSGNGANRTLRVTPAGNLSGEADITITASDGTKSAEATFHLIVQKVISMGTNLVENGNGTSDLASWSGNTVNIDATGDGFRTCDPSSSMSQNLDISKFSSLIDGGQTDFLLSTQFPSGYGRVSARFYTDIACTNPVGSSFSVQSGSASLTQKIPANAKGVTITFVNTHWDFVYITIKDINFVILNNFPKIAPVSPQTTALSALTVPVYPYYTTASATLTATSSDQTIVPNGGITTGGSGFNRSVTFTPLKDGTVTITLTLNDGSTSTSATFDVTVHDPAKVSGIDMPAPGFYGVGGALDFTVKFNHPVSGGTGSTLPLSIGGSSVTAAYLSNTADSITYRYTISSSNSGAVTIGAAINAAASPIIDSAGYDANLDLNAGATGLTVVRAPQVTSTAAGGIEAYGTKITFTASLSCADSLSGTVQFKADGNNLGAPVAISSNTASYESAETTFAVGSPTITAEFVPSGASYHFTSLASSAYAVTIEKKVLTISGAAATNRAYNGATSVALTGGSLVGVEPADAGSVGFSLGAGAMADAKAGNGKPVSTSIALLGAQAGNYSLSQPAGITVDISKATLSLQSAVAANKAYDSTAIATVSSVTFNGLVSGESLEAGVDYTASGLFSNVNVSDDIPVTVSVALTTTEKSKNYTLSFGEVGSAASIAKKALTISGVSATNRAYNGTTSVTLAGGSLVGVETADAGSVGFSLGAGAIVDAKAGNGKPVSTSIALLGAQAGNYSLPQPAGITVDISKAVLSIHSAVVDNKVYDGTTAAVISDVVLNGLIPGESLEAGVDYTVSGLFGNANAGNDIPVTVSVTPTTTEKAANYAVSGTGSFMANITKKALVISGVSATNRAYDGTSAVVLAGGALGGVAATDTGSVSFSLGVGAMADAKAGSGKPVSTNIVLTGAKAANYSLTQPTGITVDISKAALSIHDADIANKVYNGTTAATVSNLTFSGLASGESLEAGVDYTVSSLFDSANAGNNIPVTVSVTLATTEKATNYAVSGTGSFMADITPRGLTGGVVVDVDNTTGQAALVDEGDMLRANTSGVSVPGTLTVSYQWYRNGATIAGATLASYTVGNLSADPAGTSFTVKVTGTGNYMGTLESAAKVVSQLPLAGSISITGSTAVGNTLSLDASLLTPAAATYDIIWMRGDVPIGGATGVDYTIVREDVGKTLSVVITATGNYTGTKRASLRISAGGISGSSPYVPAYAILNQTGRATVDLTAGSTLVSAEQFSQLMALNADKPVVMRGRGYNITFPQGSMRSIGGYSGDLNFGISFNMGAHYAAIKSAAGDDFILMLQFIHSGPLPGTAQVSIYVGTQYAGQSLQYLYYNPQAGKLEPMQTATVDTNGYITVTQDHCSSYAVTFYGPIDIPKTGDSEPGIWGWLIAGISAWGMIAILTSWGPKRKHPGRTF